MTSTARLALVLVTAAAASHPPLEAQVTVGVQAGVRYSSTLVHDSIVTPFDVRPALAPVAAITVAGPRQRSWTPTVTLDFSMSNLELLFVVVTPISILIGAPIGAYFSTVWTVAYRRFEAEPEAPPAPALAA